MNDSKGTSIFKIVLVLLVIIASFFVAWYGIGEQKLFSYHNIKLGLDLQGGVNIVYEAAVDNDPTPEEMSAAVQMIQVRLDKENYTEAEVAIEGNKRIRVNIPGVEDPQEAIADIGATALLTFEDEEGNVVLEGKNIEKASAQMVDTGFMQEAVVSIKLDKEGTEAFKTATQNNIGKPIIIKLDGIMISAPTVNDVISNGESMISGSFTTTTVTEDNKREANSLCR